MVSVNSWTSCGNVQVITDSRSNSDEEAHQDQRRLETLIERVLAENSELHQKLHESEVFSRSSANVNPTIRESRNIDQGSTSDQTEAGKIGQTATSGAIIRFAFEPVLQASRVYLRHEQRNECDVSFSSSAQRSHAWSALAGYSLADVSILSVIAMPLTAADVVTGAQYYTGARADKHATTRSRRDRGMGMTGDGEYDTFEKLWSAYNY